jgi:hypothetical protein
MRGIPSFVEEILTSQEGLLHGHVFYLFIYLHFIYLLFNSTPCLQETIFRNFIKKFASVERHTPLPFIRHLEPFRVPWRTRDSLLSNPSPLKFSPHLLICKFWGWHRWVLRFFSYIPRVLTTKLLNSAQTVCLCVSDDSDNVRCHWLPRTDQDVWSTNWNFMSNMNESLAPKFWAG